MTETQKADPRTRRKTIIFIFCAALIGVLFILAFEHYRPAIEDWLTRDPEQAVQRFQLVLICLGLLISIPLLLFAAYFLRFGARIVEAERFPPPGAGVIRDTPVVAGPAARRRGRLIQAVAVLFIFIALAAPVLLWHIASLLDT